MVSILHSVEWASMASTYSPACAPSLAHAPFLTCLLSLVCSRSIIPYPLSINRVPPCSMVRLFKSSTLIIVRVRALVRALQVSPHLHIQVLRPRSII